MYKTAVEKEYLLYVVELMQSIGPVYAKAMFGGYGIYLDGLMFALISDQVLYLKVDKQTESEFKDRGLEAFSYYRKGNQCQLSYRRAPDDALEDTQVMNYWTNMAYAAATRAASGKRKK
jgi:DNA transformation protein